MGRLMHTHVAVCRDDGLTIPLEYSTSERAYLVLADGGPGYVTDEEAAELNWTIVPALPFDTFEDGDGSSSLEQRTEALNTAVAVLSWSQSKPGSRLMTYFEIDGRGWWLDVRLGTREDLGSFSLREVKPA
jgi:hypothetical protein